MPIGVTDAVAAAVLAAVSRLSFLFAMEYFGLDPHAGWDEADVLGRFLGGSGDAVSLLLRSVGLWASPLALRLTAGFEDSALIRACSFFQLLDNSGVVAIDARW